MIWLCGCGVLYIKIYRTCDCNCAMTMCIVSKSCSWSCYDIRLQCRFIFLQHVKRKNKNKWRPRNASRKNHDSSSPTSSGGPYTPSSRRRNAPQRRCRWPSPSNWAWKSVRLGTSSWTHVVGTTSLQRTGKTWTQITRRATRAENAYQMLLLLVAITYGAGHSLEILQCVHRLLNIYPVQRVLDLNCYYCLFHFSFTFHSFIMM